MKKLIFITVILLLLTTCILIKPNWSSPNSITGSNNTVIQTTTGQELIDLQQALDSGVITQEEYDDKFIELLNGYEHPWCICMTQCMLIDSTYCSKENNNPLNSLKNKIKYNNSIKSDSTNTN